MHALWRVAIFPQEEMKTRFGLQAIRRVNDNGHHYFISSLQDKGVDDWVTLGTKAEAAALFNPMTGECGEARIRQTGDQTQVYLQLKSGESVILQTYQQPLTGAKSWKYIQEQPFSLSLNHGWKLHFAESQPEIKVHSTSTALVRGRPLTIRQPKPIWEPVFIHWTSNCLPCKLTTGCST